MIRDSGITPRVVDFSLKKRYYGWIARIFEVKAWPNPSTQYFNLYVESGNPDEQVVIKIFDFSGKLVQMINGAANTNLRFGDKVVSGTYIVEVRQGNRYKVLKILKQD